MNGNRRTWSVYFWQTRMVLATYLRWSVWVLLFFAVVAWSFQWSFRDWNGPNSSRRVAIQPRPWHTFEMYSHQPTTAEEQRVFKVPENTIKDWSQIKSLWINGSVSHQQRPAFPPEVTQCRQLQALRVMLIPVYRTVADWERLSLEERKQIGDARPWLSAPQVNLSKADVAQLPNAPLTYLELENCTLEAGVLAEFGRRFQIKSLVIDTNSLQRRYDDLTELRDLELLEIQGETLTPQVIEAVLQLPHLEVLVINTASHMPATHSWRKARTDLTLADLQPLKNHAALKWVFAEWKHQGLDALQVRQQMLPIRALPTVIRRHSQWVLQAGMWGMSCILGLISIQMWSHFLAPHSVWMPRYAAPHFTVPVLILAVAVLISGVLLKPSSLATGPAISVLLLLPAVASLLICGLVKSQQALQQMVGMVFGLSMGMNMLPLMILLDVFGAWGYWYLWGEAPLVTAGVLTAEIGALILAGIGLRRVARRSLEDGVTPQVNFTVTPQAQAQTFQQMWWFPKNQTARQWDWHGHRPWARRLLWADSLAVNPAKAALFMSGMITVFLVLWLSFTMKVWENQNWMYILWGPLLIAGAFTPQIVSSWWLTRIPSLAEESLRPMSRETFISDLFWAYLWTCRATLLVIPGGILFFIHKQISPMAAGALSLFLVGGLFLMIACGTFVFAIRAGSMMQFFVVIPCAVLAQAMIMPLVFIAFSQNWQTPLACSIFAVAGVCTLLLGAAVWALAYQKALHREWGLK